MSKEIVKGIFVKMDGYSGKGDFIDSLAPEEKSYLEQVREQAFRIIEENFKIVRNATDILEQNRTINPKIVSEPLDATWLANLPDIQRNRILEIKKRQEEILNQNNI